MSSFWLSWGWIGNPTRSIPIEGTDALHPDTRSRWDLTRRGEGKRVSRGSDDENIFRVIFIRWARRAAVLTRGSRRGPARSSGKKNIPYRVRRGYGFSSAIFATPHINHLLSLDKWERYAVSAIESVKFEAREDRGSVSPLANCRPRRGRADSPGATRVRVR